MLKNTQTTYGSITKFFHWTMAILFLAMFIFGFTMTNISASPVRSTLYDIHKSTGLLLFGFFAFRLFWRLVNVEPEMPTSVPTWQKRIAKLNIIALYCVMFIMPITGFLTSTLGGHDVSFYWIFKIAPLANDKNLSEFFSEVHEIIAYLMIAFVVLHFLGALYHHCVQKDEVLRRILPSRS